MTTNLKKTRTTKKPRCSKDQQEIVVNLDGQNYHIFMDSFGRPRRVFRADGLAIEWSVLEQLVDSIARS